MTPSTANLAALYASLNGRATTPFKLVTVMTRPVRAVRMAGNTALVTRDPEGIQRDRVRQLLHRELFEGSAMSGAGVVNQQVDTNQVGEDGADARVDRF